MPKVDEDLTLLSITLIKYLISKINKLDKNIRHLIKQPNTTIEREVQNSNPLATKTPISYQ